MLIILFNLFCTDNRHISWNYIQLSHFLSFSWVSLFLVMIFSFGYSGKALMFFSDSTEKSSSPSIDDKPSPFECKLLTCFNNLIWLKNVLSQSAQLKRCLGVFSKERQKLRFSGNITNIFSNALCYWKFSYYGLDD